MPDRRRGALAVGLGLGLGVAIAAATLLPGLVHASRTIRAAGLTDSMANEWSMPAVRILELFSPHVLGHVDRNNLARYWGHGYYGAKAFAFYYSLYPGLLISLLALRAWCTRRRALVGWGAAAVLGYLVALGEHFPLWPLLRQLPGLAAIRYPEKAALLWFFPTVVVASYGFDGWVMGRQRRGGFLGWAALVVAALGLLGALALALAAARVEEIFSVWDAARDALRMSAVGLGIALALWLGRTWRRQRRGLLLCAVLCLDLVSVGRALVPTVPVAALAAPPEFLVPLVRGGDHLLFHLAEWDAQRSGTGGLAKPPWPARWGLPTTLERDFDFTQLRWTFESTRAWLLTANADQRLLEPMLQRRGVTALVRFGPGVHWQGDRLVRPGGGPLVEALFAEKTNGFAFAASRVEIVRDVADWQAKVRELGAAVVGAACVEASELPEFPNPPGPATLELRRSSPEDLVIAVDAAGPNPSFVAVNQTWDPNWRVALDGKPARLLRTDLALSGVLVPPGAHRLEFEYRDAWVSAGLVISGAASVGALLALLWARRRARR